MMKLRRSFASGSWLGFVGLLALTLFAVATGIVSLRYALPRVPFPAPIPNFVSRRPWIVAHAVMASVALLVGPWQFFPGFRVRYLGAHRWLGRVYCVAVLAGWLTSLPIAVHASFGAVSAAGFLGLGLFWVTTTVQGYRTIRRGQVTAHRKWMIRSFALTCAAITLRLYIPLSLILGLRFELAYRGIAWLCWVPNLLLAEVLIRATQVPPDESALFSP